MLNYFLLKVTQALFQKIVGRIIQDCELFNI